jgi:carbon-monoxide dehydrogenase small subunit
MTTVTVTPPPVTKLSEVAPSGLLTLNVNGNDKELIGIEPYYTLSFVLREKLGLVGTKVGCNEGECGTCAVIVDGKSVYSCIMLAMNAAGKKILTIEGLANGQTLGPIQQKFFDAGASQCGFCTPGFIMATKALLDEKPTPTLAEVKEGLSGHICGCGHTTRIVSAVSGAY